MVNLETEEDFNDFIKALDDFKKDFKSTVKFLKNRIKKRPLEEMKKTAFSLIVNEISRLYCIFEVAGMKWPGEK